jgi:aarF domain-containing kinase
MTRRSSSLSQIVSEALPIDYYKVFCELERTLIYELDFLHEAQASAKVAAAVAHSPRNKPRKSPVTVPLPIPGLVSKRVMVMEFVQGVALSKIAAEMQKRGEIVKSVMLEGVALYFQSSSL